MERTLVVGFGNSYRRDDGAGRAVVNLLRENLGRQPLADDDDGFDDLGHRVDAVVLHQLVPELAEDFKEYDQVIFVDAHTGNIEEPLYEKKLEAAYETPFVYHQTRPETILALAKQMHGKSPEGVLLSLRGYDFDFGQELSTETAALVPKAVSKILQWVEEDSPADA
ncbi:MAG: hydrogenase maturation protease [Anaerolineae bacterium]